MLQTEFLEKVTGNENLEIIEEFTDKYILLNKITNKKYEVKKNYLVANNWENISSVLEGREPIILDGITRIVGYFSKTSNWNKSKIGELQDRRTGNYKVGC